MKLAPHDVLFLGAHPDDEMGCFGTLRKLAAEGAAIRAITFSDCFDAVPIGFSHQDLMDEWKAAFEYIYDKAPIRQLSYCMDMIPNRRFPEYRQRILDELDQYRDMPPDLVLVPASSDTHQDHATVRTEAIRAFKQTSTILGYELPMNTVGQSQWQCFVPLTPDQVEAKIVHAGIYKTQAAKPYMQEAFIRGNAAVRGVQAGVPAAEAFEVIRWIA